MTIQVDHFRQGGGVANDKGVAWVGYGPFTDATSAYAFATLIGGGPCSGCVGGSGDTTSHDEALPSLPLIASQAETDANGLYFNFAFAAPPGSRLCVHFSVVRQVA